MIKANETIFNTLIGFVKQTGIEVPKGIRYIRTNDEEKKWVKFLRVIDKLPILPNLHTALLEFENARYFCVLGLDDSAPFQTTIDSVPLNAGIVTALLYEFNSPLKKKIDPYRIVEELLYQYSPDVTTTNDYKGHDFNDVLSFFEPILLYQIQNNTPVLFDDICRLSGFFIHKNSENFLLPFSNDTLSVYERIFFEGSRFIPFENFISSITTAYWNFSFLSVYRCLERLFPLLMLDRLHQEVKTPLTLFEFSKHIENLIGWRPREEDVIVKLVSESPEEATQLLSDVKKKVTGSQDYETGKWFYQIRNSIVHYRPATPEISLDDADWDKIIRAILIIVHYWYSQFENQLQTS